MDDETVIIYLRSADKTHVFDAEDRLRSLTKDVRFFDDPDTCVKCILSLRDETVFLVLGSRQLHAVSSLWGCIWIACIYLLDNELDEPHIPNIRGVFRESSVLLASLQADMVTFQGTHTHLVFCPQDQETSTQMIHQDQYRFFWSKILLDVVLQLGASKSNDHIMQDLLDECRLCYRDDSTELDRILSFEHSYKPTEAVHWYTGNTFLYRLLNRSLRTQNIMVIFKFRKIIQDLYAQLHNEHEEQIAQPGSFRHIVTYRGQKITFAELENIKRNVGCLISLNSFFSTSSDLEFAKVMSGMGLDPLVASIVFEILIDRANAQNFVPFADITDLNQMQDEPEILLCMGTILRIDSVKTDDIEKITWIRLSLCAYESERLLQMKEAMQLNPGLVEYLSESRLMLALARILLLMGEHEKASRLLPIAQKQYEQENKSDVGYDELYELLQAAVNVSSHRICMIKPTLSQLGTQLERISHLPASPSSLGTIARDFQSSLCSCFSQSDPSVEDLLESLSTLMSPELLQFADPDHAVVAPSILDMPIAYKYSMQGDHQRAMAMYEKLLKEHQNLFGPNHTSCIYILMLLASEAKMLEDEEKLIAYNHELLNLHDTSFDGNNSAHLQANRDLAEFYEKRNEPEFALQFYENIINMRQLSPHNYFRIEALRASARIYSSFSDYDRALNHRLRAMELDRESDRQLNNTEVRCDDGTIMMYDPFVVTIEDAKRMKNEEAALRLYQQCLQTTDPIENYDRRRRILANDNLARYMEKRNDNHAALQYYECVVQLISLSPNDKDLWLLRIVKEKCTALHKILNNSKRPPTGPKHSS